MSPIVSEPKSKSLVAGMAGGLNRVFGMSRPKSVNVPAKAPQPPIEGPLFQVETGPPPLAEPPPPRGEAGKLEAAALAAELEIAVLEAMVAEIGILIDKGESPLEEMEMDIKDARLEAAPEPGQRLVSAGREEILMEPEKQAAAESAGLIKKDDSASATAEAAPPAKEPGALEKCEPAVEAIAAVYNLADIMPTTGETLVMEAPSGALAETASLEAQEATPAESAIAIEKGEPPLDETAIKDVRLEAAPEPGQRLVSAGSEETLMEAEKQAAAESAIAIEKGEPPLEETAIKDVRLDAAPEPGQRLVSAGSEEPLCRQRSRRPPKAPTFSRKTISPRRPPRRRTSPRSRALSGLVAETAGLEAQEAATAKTISPRRPPRRRTSPRSRALSGLVAETAGLEALETASAEAAAVAAESAIAIEKGEPPLDETAIKDVRLDAAPEPGQKLVSAGSEEPLWRQRSRRPPKAPTFSRKTSTSRRPPRRRTSPRSRALSKNLSRSWRP